MKTAIRKIPGLLFLSLLLYVPLREILRKLRAQVFYKGVTYKCPVCEKSFRKFLDARAPRRTVFFQDEAIGERRKNAICPYCRAPERLRFEYLCLQQHTDIFTHKNKVLHIAPELALTKCLRKKRNVAYFSGDIQKGRAMYVVDITDICFGNGDFDYVICNHVLEHVSDDRRALSEMYRVLKPGGKAIITVPIFHMLETTLEHPTASDEERLALYGQRDHARLYGKDFPERMQNAGFEVITYSAGMDIPDELIEKYALSKGETVYVGIKH